MILVAHRGCAAQYPENSLEAVRKCSAHVDRIEIDVRRCKTDELIVIRDQSFERVAGVDKNVRETTLDEIRSLTIFDSEESPPTLSEVIHETPSRVGLHVDLKEAGLTQSVIEQVIDIPNDVILISSEPELLEDIQSNELALGYVFHDNPEQNVETAAELGCSSIEPHHTICTPELVERARKPGFEVIGGGGISDQSTFEKLRTIGVDGAMVDHYDFD